MVGSQILIIISVAMVTGGFLLRNFFEANKVEGLKISEQELFWAISTGALLAPIGVILFMASIALMIVKIRDSVEEKQDS